MRLVDVQKQIKIWICVLEVTPLHSTYLFVQVCSARKWWAKSATGVTANDGCSKNMTVTATRTNRNANDRKEFFKRETQLTPWVYLLDSVAFADRAGFFLHKQRQQQELISKQWLWCVTFTDCVSFLETRFSVCLFCLMSYCRCLLLQQSRKPLTD